MVCEKYLTPEQLKWEQLLTAELAADKKAEQAAEAERVAGFVNADNRTRQGEAFDLCCVWGLTESQAAVVMGCSQQNVAKLLQRHIKDNPKKKPSWYWQEKTPEAGFHRPGKFQQKDKKFSRKS